MSLVFDGTNGITFPDGETQAVAGAGMYKWKANEAPSDNEQEHSSDTAVGEGVTTQFESGPTVTLAAGEELVLRIHELEFRCDTTAEVDFTLGLHDGTTFYPMYGQDQEYTANFAVVQVASTSANSASTMRNNILASEDATGSNNIAIQPDGVFRAANLALGVSKTYTLAVRNNDGTNDVIIRGSSGTCKWSIGVREEI